jgi:hypothetical protein
MPISEPVPAARPRPARTFEPFAMARASVILAMLLLLKSHLKAVYSLSEE